MGITRRCRPTPGSLTRAHSGMRAATPPEVSADIRPITFTGALAIFNRKVNCDCEDRAPASNSGARPPRRGVLHGNNSEFARVVAHPHREWKKGTMASDVDDFVVPKDLAHLVHG